MALRMVAVVAAMTSAIALVSTPARNAALLLRLLILKKSNACGRSGRTPRLGWYWVAPASLPRSWPMEKRDGGACRRSKRRGEACRQRLRFRIAIGEFVCSGLSQTSLAGETSPTASEFLVMVRWLLRPQPLMSSTNNRRFVPGRALGEIEIAQVPRWLIRLDAAASGVVTGNLAHTATGVTRLPAEPQASRTIVMVPTSEIAPARINWIWPGIIASGSVTGLVGYPGLGKSQVAIDIAATVSTGRQWPGDAANGNAGDVIILSAEDDVAHTIVPRLIAAGANRDRVHAVKAVKEDDRVERAFNLALDLDRLDKDNDIGPVKLLVIDPVSAYLTPTKGRRVDRNNAGDARAILGRLATFAARHGLGVLAISHLNKSNGARAITRTTGSLEWVAAPRAVYLVTEEARTERRLFLPLKNNLAPDRTGYAFEIENRVVADGIRTSAVVWSSDPVTISADEALAAAAKKVTFGAVDFLQQALSEGPMDQTEIVRRGREAGFSEKNLRTAREKLGVTPRKEGFGAGGRWVWVPAGGASVLRLAVNNGANGHTAGAADKTAPDANARDQGTVPERGNAGNDAEKPTEGDLT